jgi:ABC-type uncharacterized transport system substrate-binding protein
MAIHLTRDRVSSRRRVLAGTLLCTALLVSPPANLAADNSARVVVAIPSTGPYRAPAESAIEHLRAQGVDCELLVVPDDGQDRQETFEGLRTSSPAVILTGGVAITTETLEAVPKIPIVFFMVPNALDASFLDSNSPHRRRVAGVPMDVAPDDQVQWIRRTAPECRRLAVLCTEHSERTAVALQAAGRRCGVEIAPVHASSEQFPAAVEALEAARFEGVVMILDSQVYNSATVQHLLLWGLRQKRPLWAFSEKVVKAGALAGVYCNTTQIGTQASEIAHQILRGKSPQAIGMQYSRQPDYAVNVRVAEMIGVRFKNELLLPTVVKFGETD